MPLGSHLEEITSMSTMHLYCSDGIKLSNSKMGGVDLMDQLKSAYQLYQRSKYLRLFFYLFDVALVNSFIVYKKLENKDLTVKELKICIALKLIASFATKNYLVRTIVHPSAPNLKDLARCLHHICQFSRRQDDD